MTAPTFFVYRVTADEIMGGQEFTVEQLADLVGNDDAKRAEELIPDCCNHFVSWDGYNEYLVQRIS